MSAMLTYLQEATPRVGPLAYTGEPKLSPVIPEAERSEAIRDLHRRVELPRSRIGALLAQALASLRPG
jgi:hypothetical protein